MATEDELLTASELSWEGLSETDWAEAFRSHPRIGELRAEQLSHPRNAVERSATWSAREQNSVATADDAIKTALADANREYENRFGRRFVVCAIGKSATEILAILYQRLQNDERRELREAVEQLRQITQIRLKKWLEE